MGDKLNRCKNKRDLLRLLQCREIGTESGKILKYHTQFTTKLIERLVLEHELEGHKGCVNCLQWSPDGRQLLSGSDDTNVILWDPFRHKLLQVIPTGHIGNIFSVKYLGNNNNIIATAAGDNRILVQTVNGAVAKNAPLLECECHLNRVKRLAVSPEEPSLFWSAAEDGLVIQYDLREAHECPTRTKILVDLSSTSEMKCIAVNPTKPHYLAVGTNDCYVRMYDRRKFKPFVVNESIKDARGKQPTDPNCVQLYAPGHLIKDNAYSTNLKFSATYVSFNTSGSEMLANIGGEQIYLFDLNNSRDLNDFQVPQFTVARNKTDLYKCNCGVEIDYNRYKKSGCLHEETCACFYTRRALSFHKRKWMGDMYYSARQYLQVIRNWPNHQQSYIFLIKTLIFLNWTDEAKQWLDYFCKLYPDYGDQSVLKGMRETIETLKYTNEKNSERKPMLKLYCEDEVKLRLNSKDYDGRFIGHCNTTTDIKEANFLGDNGDFICAGSDEGYIFIWDRNTGSIVTALIGDGSIVNCIQPHPSACFIASSGIDPAVKLWSPKKDDGSKNPQTVRDIEAVVMSNQHRMSLDPFESMFFNIGFRSNFPNSAFQDAPCNPC